MIALAVILIIVCAAGYWYRRAHDQAHAQAPAPIFVQTLTVTPHLVPEVIETSGTVISPQSVQVFPQTSGILETVRIRDGEQVRKGQVLFTIDPRPLRAALAQSRATLVRDQALAADAQDTARRYKPLAQIQAVDTKSYVTAAETARSLQGTVALDRAAITASQLSLGYTAIRAPISGRAGAVLVKPGTAVTAGSATPLVILNVASPIEVSFALPHVQVDAVRRAVAARGGAQLPVLVMDSVSGKPLDRGTLYFTDNAFDDSSGTLAMRARLANGERVLTPGQFVTVRVVLAEDPVTLAVPETALQQGQSGPYVYVMANGKAVVRQLAVARLVDGQAVVTKGLRAGDQIILTVPNELRDGTAVQSSNHPANRAAPVAATK